MDRSRRLYRRRHHATEREAAEAIEPHISHLQAKVYDCAVNIGDKGFTLVEISAALGTPNKSTVRTRVSELVDKGLIYETDDTRIHPPSPRRHIVWRVTPTPGTPSTAAQLTLL